jgi:hypothetical protein
VMVPGLPGSPDGEKSVFNTWEFRISVLAYLQAGKGDAEDKKGRDGVVWFGCVSGSMIRQVRRVVLIALVFGNLFMGMACCLAWMSYGSNDMCRLQ